MILGSTLSLGDIQIMGDGVGNGGDAVVCRALDDQIRSVEVLDYFEGREFRVPPIVADLGTKSVATHEKIVSVADRLKELSPLRAERLKQQALHVISEALFTQHKLDDISDSLHLGFPQGCRVEQFAITVEDPLPQEPLYVIQKELWDKSDFDAQAGIALHEAIYQEAVRYGHKNSRRARHFNAWLAADKFQGMTLPQFIDWLRKLSFHQTDIEGVWYQITDTEPTFYSDATLHTALFVEDTREIPVGSTEVILGCPQSQKEESTHFIEYYPGQRLRQGNLAKVQGLSPSNPYVLFGDSQSCESLNNRVWFYENGRVEKGTVSGDFPFLIQDQKVNNYGSHCMEFFSDGNTKSACVDLKSPLSLRTVTGVRTFNGINTFILNQEGEVLYSQRECDLPVVCSETKTRLKSL